MRDRFGITIQEILQLDLLSVTHLLAGEKGIDHEVTNVNVMEVPDIVNWVKRGELLLTTAYSIKDKPEVLLDMIPKFVEIGVAGMAIKTKRYIDELPPQAIALADELNFPLIEIPLSVAYGDVITTILSAIVDRRADVIKKIDLFTKKLTKLMLRGGGLEEITLALGEALQMPVVIKEAIFGTVSVYAHHEDKEDLLQKIAADVEINTYHRVAIETENQYFGEVIIVRQDQEISQEVLMLVEASNSLIALELMKKISVFENENKHRIEFIDDLLSQDEHEMKKAIEKANFFNFDQQEPHSVLIIAINDFDSSMTMTPNNARYLQSIKNKLISISERLQRKYGDRYLSASKRDRIIVLLGHGDLEDKKGESIAFAEHFLSLAKLEGIENKISIGIGRSYAFYKQLGRSHQEAQRSIENALLALTKKAIVHYDELGIYRILSYEELQPELANFYHETLGELAHYDDQKSSELIETLRMYFLCRGNVKKVSEEMFAHYNTIIYRLQRIKDILGVDFEDPDVQLNLQIALKIQGLLPKNLL